MRSSSKAKWFLAVTYGTMLAIVASACGGASTAVPPTDRPAAASSASAAAPAAVPATPTVPPRPVTVRLGLATVNWLWVTYMAAEGLGIFKKHNLDVQMSLSQGTALESGLISGSLDVAGVASNTQVFVSAKQPGVVSLAYSQINGSPFSLVVDPSIAKLEDLRGKVVVVSSVSTDGFVAQQILSSAGLKAGTDYTFLLVSAGGPAGRAAAMVAKQAQAVLVYEPDVTTLKAQGFRELTTANQLPLLRDATSFTLVVNSSWAKANRETVVTFLKAWMEAANAVYDPAKKSAVVAAVAGQMKVSPELVAAAHDSDVKRGFWNRSCKVVSSQLEALVQQAINSKDIEAPGPKTADMILDPAYCDAALK